MEKRKRCPGCNELVDLYSKEYSTVCIPKVRPEGIGVIGKDYEEHWHKRCYDEMLEQKKGRKQKVR